MLPKHYRAVLHRARWMAVWLCVFVLVVFVGTFFAFLRTPLVAAEQKTVNIIFPVGSSLVQLSQLLKQQGLLAYPSPYLVFLAYLRQASMRLHAGEYTITPGLLPGQLLTKMVNDDVLWRNMLFVEGTTWRAMNKQLTTNPYLLQPKINLTSAQIATKLHIPTSNLEGWFFPDTYRYTAGLNSMSLLRQAHHAMEAHLQRVWMTKDTGLPYRSAYDLLIVASLIEKEAKIASDYPRIGGVIIKRLQLGMPLQIDASVIYGLGDAYDGQLKLSQLKQESPYNTYLHKGLPPSPIAMPGEASLMAAAHPIINHDIFYVASGNGGHVFSATLKQQNLAVAHYRLFQKQHQN
jgi:UPF0755 protein